MTIISWLAISFVNNLFDYIAVTTTSGVVAVVISIIIIISIIFTNFTITIIIAFIIVIADIALIDGTAVVNNVNDTITVIKKVS